MKQNRRAQSVDNPNNQKHYLPSILTPTFGDWKLIDQTGLRFEEKEHPKICRKNPLYNKFCLNQMKQDLNQEGIVNKENFVAKTPTTNKTDENFSSIEKMEILINFPQKQYDYQQQAYYNPNINQHYKVQKKSFNPVIQNSPLSLRSAEASLYINDQYSSQRKQKIQPQLQFNWDKADVTFQKLDFDENILEQQKIDIKELQNEIEQCSYEQRKAEQRMMKDFLLLIDNHKKRCETILKNSSLFYKYSKQILIEQTRVQQQAANIFNSATKF